MENDRERTRGYLRESAQNAASALARLTDGDGWLYRYAHYDTKTGAFSEESCLAPNTGAAKELADTLKLLAEVTDRLYGAEGEDEGEYGVILIPEMKGAIDGAAENEGM